MSIGSKVRKYREAKGFSQEDLAFRLDVAQTTISSIESDKSIPNSILLNKIAKELDVNINDILNDEITIINSNNGEHSTGYAAYIVNHQLSEKLIEQYEERLKDMKEQIEYWKSKANGA